MIASGPTLKCVMAWSDRRNLCTIVEDAMRARIPSDSLLRVNDDTLIVDAPNGPAEIRNWVRSALEDSESVLVVEFERWSGYGASVDSDWLMRRGH
jgi:hypothetical protein